MDWMIRIMLIDNNSGFIGRLEEALKKTSKQYSFVYRGADASNALMSFSALQPDLIIADIRMPGIDGIATTQIIKEENPSCVCILLGEDERACKFTLMQRVIRAHCDDFMEANISVDDIAAVLLQLRRADPQAQGEPAFVAAVWGMRAESPSGDADAALPLRAGAAVHQRPFAGPAEEDLRADQPDLSHAASFRTGD